MDNPLAKHLAATRESQKAFADRLGCRQATVSGWCNSTIPSIVDAARIEAATAGAVPVSVWAEYAQATVVYTAPRITCKAADAGTADPEAA